MTRDDIIAMAREAGAPVDVSTDPNSPPSWWGCGHNDVWERFASLAEARAIAKEREACAQLVLETDQWRSPGWTSSLCPITKQAIAAAIRARSQS